MEEPAQVPIRLMDVAGFQVCTSPSPAPKAFPFEREETQDAQQHPQAASGSGQGWVCSRLGTSATPNLISSFLNREMKVWHGVVIAVVSLVLQACLIAAVNYLLSRRMGNWLNILFPPGSLQGPLPSLQQDEPPLEPPNIT